MHLFFEAPILSNGCWWEKIIDNQFYIHPLIISHRKFIYDGAPLQGASFMFLLHVVSCFFLVYSMLTEVFSLRQSSDFFLYLVNHPIKDKGIHAVGGSLGDEFQFQIEGFVDPER